LDELKWNEKRRGGEGEGKGKCLGKSYKSTATEPENSKKGVKVYWH
jgi:hypothetical protein